MRTVLDLWSIEAGGAVYTLTCREDRGRDLWRLTLSDDNDQTHWALSVTKTAATAPQVREITRHIARNAVRGALVLPPVTKLQTVGWDTAVGIAGAFVEGFGVADELRGER